MIAVAMQSDKSLVVPGTGIEPVRPLFRKAADFKKNHTNDSVNKYGHFSTKKVIE